MVSHFIDVTNFSKGRYYENGQEGRKEKREIQDCITPKTRIILGSIAFDFGSPSLKDCEGDYGFLSLLLKEENPNFEITDQLHEYKKDVFSDQTNHYYLKT